MSNNKNQGFLRCLLLGLLVIASSAHAVIPPGYTVLETITYEYDTAGNRLSKSATVAGVPETPIVAQYDQSNRLTQLTLKGQGSNGADLNCTLSYDANGNLTNKSCADVGSTATSTTRYIWDARNRLIQIDGPGVQAQFQYDALGRRTERTLNGDSTQYLYDGSQAIAELKNNAVTAVNLTGLVIDEVIARYTSEGERTLLTDALGSVILAAKEDASVVTAYGYSPYGETQIMGTDEQNPVQYTARENDQAGLYYYRARYYDPQSKRFVSEDPIGLEGGMNIYAYVSANPLNYNDPLGLEPIDPNGKVPGGPWEPASGQRPGDFWGPKKPSGGRDFCRYVPPGASNPDPYWKTKSPGGDWQRYNLGGNPITPEQAHPGNPPKQPTAGDNIPPAWARNLGPLGVAVWGLTHSGNAW